MPSPEAAFFQAIENRVGTHVKMLDQAIQGTKAQALRPLGLTVPQYATLLAIRTLEPTTGAVLARASMATPQTVSTMLAALEARGLVSRAASDLHQRLLVTELTPAGTDLTAQADTVASGLERRLREAIGEERFATLVEIAEIVGDLTAAERSQDPG